MKILILTQYFPPEVGAPQNRLHDLALRLKGKGAEVSVLTAMPNYPQMQIYEGYENSIYRYEENEGLKIHRAFIFVSTNRSMLSRLLNYFSFVFSSFLVACFKIEKNDYILCESPPLFLGIAARLIKMLKGSRLIFNVSDLWPETAVKLGLVQNDFLIEISTWLEEALYRNSVLITGQTQGIVKHIAARFPYKQVHWLPNGVDLNFYQATEEDALRWRKKNNFAGTDFILLYAGIIGHAQGLEIIIQAATQFKAEPRIKFVILGDGPEKERLMLLKEEKQASNVYFLDTLPKKEMPSVLAGIDAAIIPLKPLDLFKGAIPSKIFENLAMKKPVLLGVEGEAKALFIEQADAGLAFMPGNSADLVAKIHDLFQNKEILYRFGENGYRFVSSHFTRDKIAADFWEVLIRIHRNNMK